MSTELDEIALGVVVGKSGQILSLSKPYDNIFVYEEDSDDQRPLSFLRRSLIYIHLLETGCLLVLLELLCIYLFVGINGDCNSTGKSQHPSCYICGV